MSRLYDEPNCYICGRKRSKCHQIRDTEIAYGIPDPHHFETLEQAEANKARRQINT